jgi:CRP-like cAMP-binding protein
MDFRSLGFRAAKGTVGPTDPLSVDKIMTRAAIDASTQSRVARKVVAAAKASRTVKANSPNGAKGAGVDALRKLLKTGPGRSCVSHKAKAVIFRQGDPADALFYVEDGRIQITVVSDHGKEGVVAILGPEDFFGEGCLAGQPHHIATARTLQPSTVVRIEKATMVRLLHDKPDISEMFMAFMLSRNIQIQADLIDQLFNSSERRLARLLLHLGNIGKEPTIETVLPKINQDMLAARIGTTRSRINYFMNKFRKLGFIEYGGKGALKVHSSLLSVVVHD